LGSSGGWRIGKGVQARKQGAKMLGFGSYNYEHFSREIFHELTRTAFSGPVAGDRAPDFKASTLDGKTVRLSDVAKKKNVLLIFGSATCPMTASSIAGINELYERFRGDDIQFLFVYVREAHPGERISAHKSVKEKIKTARLLRKEENLEMPILVDDLHGSIHRKYSRLPNPSFLIDKSGQVAFLSLWSRPEGLAAAIQELLEVQHKHGLEHVVVNDGQDLSMPLPYSALYSYRALARGGKQSLKDFRRALDVRERRSLRASRLAWSLLNSPGRILSIAALSAAVLAGGLYAGFELRKRRLNIRRNPYRAYEKEKVRDTDTGTDYGAVGI